MPKRSKQEIIDAVAWELRTSGHGGIDGYCYGLIQEMIVADPSLTWIGKNAESGMHEHGPSEAAARLAFYSEMLRQLGRGELASKVRAVAEQMQQIPKHLLRGKETA